MFYVFDLKHPTRNIPFVDAGIALTKDQCEKIIVDGIAVAQVPMRNRTGTGTMGSNVENTSYKQAVIGSLFYESYEWLFHHLGSMARRVNDQNWNFDLTGSYEGMDIITYTAPTGSIVWHTDLFAGDPSLGEDTGMAARKLNMIIQLSDPNNYQGGELQLFVPELGNNEDRTIYTAPRDQGKLIIFPTYIYHHVMPVTEGKRSSLVTYCHGKHFV
jgi:hypothetical protein